MHTHSFRRITFLIILCLFIAGMLLPGRLTSAGQPAYAPDDVITITAGNPIQIAVAMFYGFPTVQDTYDAVQMAMDDFGSIKGFSVQQNHYDAGCDLTSGSNAATAVVGNTQNTGVIGPLCSSSTQGAAPVLETAGVVMISPSNTAAGLYSFGHNIFNRMVITDPQAEAWIQYLKGTTSVKTWMAAFQTKFGRTPDDVAMFAYDATKLLLTRIQQVSTLDTGNLLIDRAQLSAVVRNTAAFSGVTGSITLDIYGDRVDTRFERVWSDQYNGLPLGTTWSWINEDPTHWSLTARPGFLRITTQNQEDKNLLLQNIPAGDFEIRTHLFFSPTEDFQEAGLILYLNGSNKLYLGRAYCDIAPPACVGNGIYFDHIEGGVGVGSNYGTAFTDDEIYLRLVFSGGVATGYASSTGTDWTEIGPHTIGFTPTKVGVFAHNSIGNYPSLGEVPADFDYFVETSNWKLVYLPMTQK